MLDFDRNHIGYRSVWGNRYFKHVESSKPWTWYVSPPKCFLWFPSLMFCSCQHNRSFTYLIIFTCKYFMVLGCYYKSNVFHSISNCLLLVCRNKIGFACWPCILHLCQIHLLVLVAFLYIIWNVLHRQSICLWTETVLFLPF